MDEKESSNANDLTLSTPPNVLSSKSSDISFEELGIEESEELEAQLASNPDTVQDDASKASEDTADKVDESIEAKETKEMLDSDKEPEADDPKDSGNNEANLNETKPEAKVVAVINSNKDDSDEDDEDDAFEDETLIERVMALSEMFPSGLTKIVSNLGIQSVDGTKWIYSKSRNLTWIVFSTATLLFLPVMLESERVGIEEMEKAKRQQILLGPSSAMSSPATNAPLPPNPS